MQSNNNIKIYYYNHIIMPQTISDAKQIPQDKKVVIDFYADWCGPCKKMAPIFVELSEEYPDIVFLKVDVEQGDLAEAFDVSALPTFLFLKNGNIITRIQGANVDALKNELNKLN